MAAYRRCKSIFPRDSRSVRLREGHLHRKCGRTAKWHCGPGWRVRIIEIAAEPEYGASFDREAEANCGVWARNMRLSLISMGPHRCRSASLCSCLFTKTWYVT